MAYINQQQFEKPIDLKFKARLKHRNWPGAWSLKKENFWEYFSTWNGDSN